jgi:[ribosomal protein S5]-alanine N-acetyltransferase
MELRTDRIFIRPVRPEDADALLELRVRNREFLQPYEPVKEESHFTLEAQRESLEAAIRGWISGTGFSFGIFLSGPGELIGRVNLSNVVRGAWQSCTLGYFMDETHNGRGYMTEAVKLVCRFAFEAAGLHRVQAAVMTWNPASSRVLEKAGFQYEGLARYYLNINGKWEDHNVYSLTKEFWEI